MKHLDLFSGIGGFALAAQTVWGDQYKNIGFCDNDKFCQQVLKKHWPNSPIYDNIRTLTYPPNIDDRGNTREVPGTDEQQKEERQEERTTESSGSNCFLVTGGFPCQPFSAAGRRKGTADSRHLWPEMFRVIREFAPVWVVAENVRGLATWNDGMVLEQVCADLESEGYEVQPFIIPAVALNAPHRRDRIWFVANRAGDRRQWGGTTTETEKGFSERSKLTGELPSGSERQDSSASDTRCERRQPGADESIRPTRQEPERTNDGISDWKRNWPEVAAELCRVDDGLPAELDGFKLTKSAHRKERLKSLGNAIVPQVAMEIFKAIKILN